MKSFVAIVMLFLATAVNSAVGDSKSYIIDFADGHPHPVTVALGAIQRDELGHGQGADFGISAPAFSPDLQPSTVFLGTKWSQCVAGEVVVYALSDADRNTLVGILMGEHTPTVKPLFDDLCEAGKKLSGGV